MSFTRSIPLYKDSSKAEKPVLPKKVACQILVIDSPTHNWSGDTTTFSEEDTFIIHSYNNDSMDSWEIRCKLRVPSPRWESMRYTRGDKKTAKNVMGNLQAEECHSSSDKHYGHEAEADRKSSHRNPRVGIHTAPKGDYMLDPHVGILASPRGVLIAPRDDYMLDPHVGILVAPRGDYMLDPRVGIMDSPLGGYMLDPRVGILVSPRGDYMLDPHVEIHASPRGDYMLDLHVVILVIPRGNYMFNPRVGILVAPRGYYMMDP
ncbi:unnamed protein product [Vicia faba]|uniref:Uncharacterized protein n=1 Tax=Vicia faba TaxID=3906 RepID=A0AAV0ZEW0_VICFA|nr:unnamed protein product [Vicia faba]